MSVIVEGVETFEELAYLEAATRIRFAQGFYFARPMSLDEIPAARHRSMVLAASPSLASRSRARTPQWRTAAPQRRPRVLSRFARPSPQGRRACEALHAPRKP